VTTTKNDEAYTLIVNFAGKEIGTLVQDKNTNLLHLHYDKNWQLQGFPITPALALTNHHSPEVSYNYLDNALPEGEARKLLAQNLGVSEKNVYSQVRELGNDLAGAITFNHASAEQNENSQSSSPIFRPLAAAELIARLDHKEDLGLLIWDDKPRLSVAGVQDKLNVFINTSDKADDNTNNKTGDDTGFIIGFGDGSLCSTHLLKFEKANCPNLVINEYFCMKLSHAVGLPTAEVNFTRFGEHPALIVKRFDRKYEPENKIVRRRHVIDGCQALNLPRDNKYERNLGDGRDVKHIRDGASLKKLFDFCKTMNSPVASTQWLINWQLFNLMINNFDSHGKNVSLFFDQNNSQFTPAYDLVNVAMFSSFKHVLAMAMGDEFDPVDIHAYQLADFAETCNINKKLLSRLLAELAKKVISTLNSNIILNTFSENKYVTKEDINYLTAVSENIKLRTEYLLSQAADIPSIAV
jgi:serine/threonine-protein kinase HipA